MSLLCRNRSLRRYWVGLPMALAACTVSAANWEIAPRVAGGYRFSDNYRLSLPGAEIEVSGAEADVAATFRTVDPRTNFEITPRINATYFPNEKTEDATNYFLTAGFSDVTPRRRIEVPFLFSEEDVVRSELPNAAEGGGLGEPNQGDSGRVVTRNRREFFRIEPSFGYDLSQRYRMELSAHYMQANFNNDVPNAQEDFSEFGAGAALGFNTSERSTLYVRALGFQYETSIKTDAYGGEFEWNTQSSENTRAYIRLGAQQTSPENGPSDSNIIAGAGGQWSTQRNDWFLDLTRSVGPISAGTVVERYQLRLRLKHDVSPRFAVRAGARLSRDEETQEGSYPTRKYATGELGFEWRWMRQWSLVGTYNYRWQEYADEPTDADSNTILFGIVYEPKRAQ